MQKIDVRVSPNEMQYPRYKALERTIASREKYFNPPVSDSSIDFDILFVLGDKKFGVECKEIEDWYGSVESEHLVDQILRHLESPFPTWIVIFGSQDDVIAAAPKFGYEGYQDWSKRLQHVLIQRGFKGDCEGFNIPVRYQSKTHKRTFDDLLSAAHNICGEPSICSWMRTKEGGLREVAVLSKWFKGVSEKRAKAIVGYFGGIVPMCIKLNDLPSNDARVAMLTGVEGIGEKTAKGIVRQMCSAWR